MEILLEIRRNFYIFTHEVMRRLAKKGYDMTLFTSEFSKCDKNEKIDGIEIIREGSKYGVYKKAKHHYDTHNGRYDIVVDEINTRPFLTPRFISEKPILAVLHQLAREFWFYETYFPLNYIGYYYLEKKWLSYYRNIPTVTVSNSSKEDLLTLGFKNIYIVPEGLSINPLAEVKAKGTTPIIAFLGRLKKAKLPHHALQAFTLIKKEMKDAQLWIIGDGYMRKELEASGVEDVIFYGHVKDELKYELLSRAHLLLVPGVREGWGLVVTESNAMGTPAVAYNVPGLRDSVKDGETGVLVKQNLPYALACSAIALLRDKELFDKLSCNALALSKRFSWDNTASAFDKIIKDVYFNYISSK